jgi:predicted dienelactone hydrolase
MRGTAVAVAILALALPVRAARLDPSAPGRFPVGVATLTVIDAARGRTLVTEVWYPATAAGRDATLRRGKFPLVLLAHGNCGFRTNYEFVSTALAAPGFLVAAPDFPGIDKAACDAGPETGLLAEPPVDLAFLRTAFHDRAGVAARFVPSVRGARTGLVGHSLGGYAVLNAAVADRNFAAVVALAPVGTAALGRTIAALDPRLPVLVLAGSADTTLPPAAFQVPFFEALATPSFMVTIQDGTHSGFTDVDGHLAADALARQQRLTNRYAIAFLERYLVRSRRFARFLTTADATAQADGVTLDARLR